MVTKADFTADEWHLLVALPYAVSTAIIASAPNVMGVWSEVKATIEAPQALAPASGSVLAGLVNADAQPKQKELIQEEQHIWRKDMAGYRTKVVAECKSVANALSKVPAEEAVAYKKWVIAVGQKVAEASKEHGVAVSDPEKEALSEISAALGLT
ncbi:hypothetical protein J2741_002563 [Methanolinea mesophila]|uniref:hypothetical protein n=1 Tax=Methanolinea mesophila TaxID=547055 RepID=UPI001AE7A6E1|nr:hypothetical protein [Methanolinea mesophila]MBP1929967.1 hypothetical protein [Methanolinea mesophila]